MSPVKHQIERSYQRIADFLANILGFIAPIKIILGIIADYTYNLVEIYNHIQNIPPSHKKTNQSIFIKNYIKAFRIDRKRMF